MKICPFVSHMLGEDMDLLAVTGDEDEKSGSKSRSKNVVILGYEDTAEAAAEGVERPKRSGRSSLPPHIQCLKDSCRFYHPKTDDCQFDLIFEMLKTPKPAPSQAAAKGGGDTKELKKDLEKIWQFQTKSVSELVATISDTEKKHKKDIDGLKIALTKSMEDFEKARKSEGSDKDLTRMAADISELSARIDEREESFESLTTTVSEMVIQMQEAIGQVDSKSDELSKGIGVLQKEMPTEKSIQEMISRSVSEISTIGTSDVSETLEEMEKKIDAAMTRYMKSLPDLKALQDNITKSIETSLKKQAAPDMDAVVKETERAHRETDLKLTKMYNDISERMSSLHKKQQKYQQRLEEVVEDRRQAPAQKEEKPPAPESPVDKKNPKEARKLNNLGVASFHNCAFDMARDQFREAVKLNPDFAEAHNNLGLACTELQQDDDARKAFERAIEINPDLHAAYNNLGYVLFKQGDYEGAIEMYTEALGRSPGNSSAYTNLGNAYFKLNQHASAEDAWSKAIELDPGNERARKNLKRIREESK